MSRIVYVILEWTKSEGGEVEKVFDTKEKAFHYLRLKGEFKKWHEWTDRDPEDHCILTAYPEKESCNGYHVDQWEIE